MKQAAIVLFLSLLFLAGCTVEEALPTTAPVAQMPTITSTPLPSTTDTPVPTSTPTSTVTATWVPANTPSSTSTPTLTPAVTLTSNVPFTEGFIAILWNPNRHEDPRVATYQLDFAFPGSLLSEWHIKTVLDGLTSPFMFPSPDNNKVALAQYVDTNNDGFIPSPRGGDSYDIDLYTINDNSLVRLSNNQFEHFPDISWLPNSQGFTYPMDREILLISLDDFVTRPLLESFPYYVHGQVWSPDGKLLAIHTKGVEEPSPPGFDNLSIYDPSSGNLNQILHNTDHTLDMRWSPDSNWLAVAPKSFGGLFLVSAEKFELVEIVEPGHRIMPVWSPNSQSLTFIQDKSRLRSWNANTGQITDLLQAEDFGLENWGSANSFRTIEWSPDNSEIIVTFWEEEKVSLIVVNSENGKVRELFAVDRVDRSLRNDYDTYINELQMLTYSPDSQWVLFFAEQGSGTGIYVMNHDGNSPAHLILQTGLYTFFDQDISIRQDYRRAVWLSDVSP